MEAMRASNVCVRGYHTVPDTDDAAASLLRDREKAVSVVSMFHVFVDGHDPAMLKNSGDTPGRLDATASFEIVMTTFSWAADGGGWALCKTLPAHRPPSIERRGQ